MRVNLLEPNVNFASLILRLGLAAIFIVHGSTKLYMDTQLLAELSPTAQKVTGALELIGGLLLAVGLFSRVAALGVIVLQTTAIVMITGKHALNLTVSDRGDTTYMRVGPEYNLVLIAMGLSVIVLGSGCASLDHVLVSRWRARKAPGPITNPLSGVP